MKTHNYNYAFIDNENVNVSVQKQKWKIDRGKFRERLRTERNVEVAYMFMGYLEEYAPMYEFFTSLGYTLVFRPMNPNPDVPNKGNIDTDLVLQAMIDRPNYNQAVIVSGDGDFASLVKHLNEQKKLATVIVPNERRYSGFLNEASGDKIVSLSLLKTTLRYKPSTKKKEEGAVRPPRQKSSTPSKNLLQHTSKHVPKKSANTQTVAPSHSAQPASASAPSTQKSSAPQPAKPQGPGSQQVPKPQTQNSQQNRPQSTNTQRPTQQQQNFKNNKGKEQKLQPQQPKPQQSQQKFQPTQNSKPTTNTGNNKPRSNYKSNDDAFYA